MNILRSIATALNLMLMVCIAFLISQFGMPSLDDEELWVVILSIIAPMLSIWVMWNGKYSSNAITLFQLMLKRRRLEQEARIRELEDAAAGQPKQSE